MSFGKTGYRDGGNRGGHDRFRWDSVKEDKYRENYLGHSLKAPVGRWQKGKDLTWYNKAGKRATTAEETAEARRQELGEIRRRDEELINEALGLAPKRYAVIEAQLDPAEVKALLARGASERDRLDVERVEGLGAAPAPRHEHLPKGKTLVERELERMKKAQEEGRAFEYEDGALHDVASADEREQGDGSDDGSSAGGGADAKKKRKEEKKRRKEEKREKKRLKKEAKREQKKEKAESEDRGRDSRRDDRREQSQERDRDESPPPNRRRGARVGSRSPSRSRSRDAKRSRRTRSRSYSR